MVSPARRILTLLGIAFLRAAGWELLRLRDLDA